MFSISCCGVKICFLKCDICEIYILIEDRGLNYGRCSNSGDDTNVCRDSNKGADEEMECASDNARDDDDNGGFCSIGANSVPDDELSLSSKNCAVSQDNSQSFSEVEEMDRNSVIKDSNEFSQSLAVDNIYRHHSVWVGIGTCDACSDVLTSREDAKNHMMTKHGRSTMYECDQCQYRVRYKSRLLRHTSRVHNKGGVGYNVQNFNDNEESSEEESRVVNESSLVSKFSRCKFCFVEVKSHYYKSHMFSVHHMKRHYQPCLYCNHTCVRVGKLADHLFHHRDLQKFECTRCSYKTVKWVYLSRHFTSEHADLLEQGCLNLEEEKERCKRDTGLGPNYFEDYDDKLFVCDQCPFTSSNHGKLNKHIMRSHLRLWSDVKLKETVTDAQIKDSYTTYTPEVKAESNIKAPHQKKFYCVKCDFVTIHESLYQEHIACNHVKEQRVPVQKLLKCEYCSFTTSYPHSIKRHFNNVHFKMWQKRDTNKVEPFQCDFCLALYPKKLQLRKHITRDHDELKPFKCTICDFKSATRPELTFHMKLHV